jgi:enoyl-CoA hydratase/carnithine racemase
MRMILMGNAERIGADTALRIHLVSEIVENGKLPARAREIAALVASRRSMASQGAVRAMWESLDLPYAAAVRNSYMYAQVGNPGTAADRAAVRAATKKEPFVVR